MHMCEALLAAFKATSDVKYLDRAVAVAESMTQRLAVGKGGWVWEHYDAEWSADWDYNKSNPKHLFRPWGYQPGHQIEWAKLCVLLHQQRPSEAWLLPTAVRLFDSTVSAAWDDVRGGLYYSLSTDRITVCDDDKYYWVQAEAIAAAALLANATGDQR